jgi:hypothetical protein
MGTRLHVIFLVAVAATSCARPRTSAIPTPGTFRGVYQTAFEMIAFTPCNSGERWWVTPVNAPGWNSLQRALHRIDPIASGPGRVQRAYVELQGDTSATGQFGHLGAYTRELRVTRVLASAPVANGQCGQP